MLNDTCTLQWSPLWSPLRMGFNVGSTLGSYPSNRRTDIWPASGKHNAPLLKMLIILLLLLPCSKYILRYLVHKNMFHFQKMRIIAQKHIRQKKIRFRDFFISNPNIKFYQNVNRVIDFSATTIFVISKPKPINFLRYLVDNVMFYLSKKGYNSTTVRPPDNKTEDQWFCSSLMSIHAQHASVINSKANCTISNGFEI